MNGQDDYLMKHFASYNERKYQPHTEAYVQNSNLPLQLLTADEKVHELTQILESKNLEIDELKVTLDQSDQGKGVHTQDRQMQNSKNHQLVQDILWLLNSTAGDVNQVQ
jgi:hypothetical protein